MKKKSEYEPGLSSEVIISEAISQDQGVTVAVTGGELMGMEELPSPPMQEVYGKVGLVARTRSTVLITGETGTGKGVIARMLHDHSNRAGGPFISVHCGSLPETLIESELFGHEKGAFTGALRRKRGKFELAVGGTIFLDEIGTISPAVQIRLLQVLQERTFQRIGGENDIPVDVRIVAAANVDLSRMVERGEFRADLFYRLNVFPIEIPPLRKRLEDIVPLADRFLRRLNVQHGKSIGGYQPQVLEAMLNYSWPGNVREMENVIERAYILETSHTLSPESFPAEIIGSAPAQASFSLDVSRPLAEVRRLAVENTERAYLKELLSTNAGRIEGSARQAGVTSRQLRNLMAKYGLRKEDFR